MLFVSITRLRIGPGGMCAVCLCAVRVASQNGAGKSRGLLLSGRGRVFWTRTIWNDEAAMRSFMLSGAHREVMPRLWSVR